MKRLNRLRSIAIVALVSVAPAVARAQDDDGPIKPPDIVTTTLPPEEKAAEAPKPGEDQVAATERRAQELFDEGKFEEAIGHWRFADGLRRDPGHDVSIARALVKVGKLLEARELLRKLTAAELPPTAKSNEVDAVAAAEDLLRAIAPRVPKIEVAVRTKKGAKYIVRLDGAAVDAKRLAAPIEVDPGAHTVEVELVKGGAAPVKRAITAKESQTEKVQADLRPPPGFEVQKLAPYALGLGAVSLGVGGVTGGLSLAKVADVKGRCVDNHCPPADQTKADSARTLGTVSTIGFVAGGALAVAGAVLFFWPREAEEPKPAPKRAGLAVGVGPGAVIVGGSF